MPISGGKYVSPTWANNASPAINSSELQAITDTIAVNGAQTIAAQLYAQVNGQTAMSYTDLSASDYIGVADVSATTGKKILVSNLVTYLQNNLGYGQFASGYYAGTGTYGQSNPTSVTFPFAPKLFRLYAYYYSSAWHGLRGGSLAATSDPGLDIYLDTLTTTASYNDYVFQQDGSTYRRWFYKSGDGKAIYWYATNGTESANAGSQWNASGRTYYWVAFG